MLLDSQVHSLAVHGDRWRKHRHTKPCSESCCPKGLTSADSSHMCSCFLILSQAHFGVRDAESERGHLWANGKQKMRDLFLFFWVVAPVFFSPQNATLTLLHLLLLFFKHPFFYVFIHVSPALASVVSVSLYFLLLVSLFAHRLTVDNTREGLQGKSCLSPQNTSDISFLTFLGVCCVCFLLCLWENV